MTYLAHTAEGFLSQPSDLPVGETDKRFWVGVTPRLAIRDADGGYARLTEGNTFEERVWTVAYLAPFTLRLPFFIDVQIRFTGTWSLSGGTGTAAVVLGISNDEAGTYIAGDADDARFGLALGPWHDVTFQIYPRDEAELTAAAAAGEVFVGLATILEPDEGYDLSFLGLRGRSQPLQWRQRTDELGVSGVRPARHASTFQATNRARGML